MKLLFYRQAVVGFILLIILIGGCASTKESRFYTLNSLTGQGFEQRPAISDEKFLIAVGPVDIPDILDRPQIVSYSGRNEIEFSEFDRWAGGLRDDIARVFMDDLSSLLAKDGISVVSWRGNRDAGYRIDLHILRFGNISGTEAALQARWTVFKQGGKMAVHMQESLITEPIDGSGYSASVAAMSRALEGLSREVAGFIRKMPSD